MEQQRRDFFAAASHELKTPVTILKGEIESMILGIGKYKDVKSILPQTLCEVERMEVLIKELLGIVRLEMGTGGERIRQIKTSLSSGECLIALLKILWSALRNNKEFPQKNTSCISQETLILLSCARVDNTESTSSSQEFKYSFLPVGGGSCKA